MKLYILTILALAPLAVTWADTTPDLCRPDLDNCPGWPLTAARQRAIDETLWVFEPRAGAPTTTPEVSCATHSNPSPTRPAATCYSTVSAAGVRVSVDCSFYDDGYWSCSGQACDASGCTDLGRDSGYSAVSLATPSLCRPDQDTCPNQPITLAALRAMTLAGASRDWGVDARGDALLCDGPTGHQRCQLTIDLDGGWLVYTCTEVTPGDVWCGAVVD